MATGGFIRRRTVCDSKLEAVPVLNINGDVKLKIYLNRLAKSCLRCNALALFPATTKNLSFSINVTICEIALFVFSCLFIASCGCAMAHMSNFWPFIAEARLRFRFDHRSNLITEHRPICHVSAVALFAVSSSVSGADIC